MKSTEGAQPIPIQPAPPQATSAASSTNQPQNARIDMEVDALLRAIAYILFNTVNARWFSSSDKHQTTGECHSIISTGLERLERLRFLVNDGEINVNGELYEAHTIHVETFVTRLSEIEDCNFTLSKGLTIDEFSAFMDLIAKSPAEFASGGGFTEMVTNQNFAHISSRKVILKEVSEEEVVISRKDLEMASEEEKKKIESDVLSLLSSDNKVEDQEKSASLSKAVQNTEQMAGLIMQAVEKKQDGAVGIDKQKVTQIVVECLDKAFEALLDDPFSKTQKGKKAIAGALQRLETELLTKMQIAPEQEESKAVGTAVERMTERLKMDSIVQDYTRKLKALESSEKQILRFIKLQGIDRISDADMKKRLDEEGVDVSDWHRLLAMSSTPDADESAAAAIAQLGQMLSQLEQNVSSLKDSSDQQAAGKLTGEIKKAHSEVTALTEKTQVKIAGLVEDVNADMDIVAVMEREAEKNGQKLKISRKRLLTVLAEVVQELRQPLVVITCSLDMMRSKAMGPISDFQKEMLDLMSDSTTKINSLTNNLEKVAGFPISLQPDKEIQASLYKNDEHPQ